MSYRFVCIFCLQALGLEAVSVQLPKGYAGRDKRSCMCNCEAAGHDDHKGCTGDGRVCVGGIPGSGAVDKAFALGGWAAVLDGVGSLHEECEGWVNYYLASWAGETADECVAIETSVARTPYEDRITMLRDVLLLEVPELVATPPYQDLRANLRKLHQFRNRLRHSYPVRGDVFHRLKRHEGQNIEIRLTDYELAENYDLGIANMSQLVHLQLRLGGIIRMTDCTLLGSSGRRPS